MAEKSYPWFVRGQTFPDEHGKVYYQWVVRNLDKSMPDGKGGTIQTPMELYNRYYTLSDTQKFSRDVSMLAGKVWVRYEDINFGENPIEY